MLNNDISITARIPSELDDIMKERSSRLGMTRTGFIRFAIHKFLRIKPADVTAVDASKYGGSSHRFVLNVNDETAGLLRSTAAQCSMNVNAVLIRVCVLAVEDTTDL